MPRNKSCDYHVFAFPKQRLNGFPYEYANQNRTLQQECVLFTWTNEPMNYYHLWGQRNVSEKYLLYHFQKTSKMKQSVYARYHMKTPHSHQNTSHNLCYKHTFELNIL